MNIINLRTQIKTLQNVYDNLGLEIQELGADARFSVKVYHVQLKTLINDLEGLIKEIRSEEKAFRESEEYDLATRVKELGELVKRRDNITMSRLELDSNDQSMLNYLNKQIETYSSNEKKSFDASYDITQQNEDGSLEILNRRPQLR